jgi:SecD/SecF fusion protein
MFSISTGKISVSLAIVGTLLTPELPAAAPPDDQPARVEFRILADTKHDRAASERALAADGVQHPPAGYRWVSLGQVVTGKRPTIGPNRLSVAGAHWADDEFKGTAARLTGKNLAGSDLSREFDITGNTADTLQLRPDPALFLKSVESFRIEETSSRVGLDPGENLITREDSEPSGRLKRLILVKLDTYNITDKDFTRVERELDIERRIAIRFELTREAGARLARLTREHLPEANGAFKYQLGIIFNGRLLSAPVLNSEVHESGIIEGGPRGFKPAEVDLIIKTLRGSRG